MRRQSILGLAMILFASASASADVTYSIIDLGTLVGRSYAKGINESGQVVGSGYLPNNHALLWATDGSITDLGYGEARGINDAGQVVGVSSGAFLWDSTNGMQPLFESSWWASGINESGQVVGAGHLPHNHAFIWENGSWINLGTLGGTDAYGEGINDIGQVVGSAEVDNYTQHAFLWENGTMTDLGVLTGGNNPDGQNDSYAYGINNAGQVVGWSDTVQRVRHAFLWDSSNGMQDLGAGDLPSEAYAVNDFGTVVGTSYFEGKPWNRAFVYSNGVMIELATLLPENSGWTHLGSANGVNNCGQIVGQGVTDSGEEHAFLMTPEATIGGYIDWVDLTIFSDKWLDGGCSDANYWCGRADINRDDYVDFVDFAWLAQYWEDTAPAPGQASNPSPENMAFGVSITADLSWTVGSDAAAHGVYFGTNPTPGANDFQAYQSSSTFDPGIMDANATYYWRIVEVGLGGMTTGAVWSFTTMIDPNLVGWWKFDETSGDIAYDSSGSENHGMLIDGIGDGLVWVPVEGALNFDGSNNLSRVVIPATGMTTTAGTIAIWANLTEPQIRDGGRNGSGYFFGCDNGGNNKILLYMDSSDTQLDIKVGNRSNNNIITLSTEAWYHIALTWNGGGYAVYVNGLKLDTGSYGGLTSLPSTADIGNNGSSSKQSFHGLMGDVQVYDKSLSAAEIQQLCQDEAN